MRVFLGGLLLVAVIWVLSFIHVTFGLDMSHRNPYGFATAATYFVVLLGTVIVICTKIDK